MSKILVDRVVLEQAVEALENSSPDNARPECVFLDKHQEAIAALRAELEQSDQKPLAVREGVHEINGERDSSETTSVAFQYRREQVAKQMAGVYKAFEASHTGDELAAALGWPGGISTPEQDPAQLLKQVAELRSQRDALLAALKLAWPQLIGHAERTARAAIDRVEKT